MFSRQKILQFVLSFTFLLSISAFATQATSVNFGLSNTTWITSNTLQLTSEDLYVISSQKQHTYLACKFSAFNFERFLKKQEHLIITQHNTFSELHVPKHLDVIVVIQRTTLPEISNSIV